MTDELFAPESVASESPRLRWMKEHGITTRMADVVSQGSLHQECLWVACAQSGDAFFSGSGATEDDALYELAQQLCIRLWNEGGISP